MSEIDRKDFRRALGQFPTGVTIITTLDSKGEAIGVTASSFNSVSIDPPLLLWSVDKSAFSAPIFSNAKNFAINVLAKEQVDLSNRFASRGEDKFNGVAWSAGEGGSPLLENCAAQFECKTWQVYEGGDHLIIVGEVTNYNHNESGAPLVFARGSYAVTMQHPSSMQQDKCEMPAGSFLPDYLLYLLRMAFTNYINDFYPKLVGQFDVSPEEWRVLSMISGNDSAGVDQLAKLVMQPKDVFEATLQFMESRGHVSHGNDSGTVSLTPKGKEISHKLYSFAAEHEAEILSDLSKEQAEVLKENLRTIIEKLN